MFIEGEKNRNRALNGDLVFVELFPQQQWNPTTRLLAGENAVESAGQALGAMVIEDAEDLEQDGLWQPQVGDEEVSRWSYKRAAVEQEEEGRDEIDVPGMQPCGKVVGLLAANEDAAMSEERLQARAHTGILFPQHG